MSDVAVDVAHSTSNMIYPTAPNTFASCIQQSAPGAKLPVGKKSDPFTRSANFLFLERLEEAGNKQGRTVELQAVQDLEDANAAVALAKATTDGIAKDLQLFSDKAILPDTASFQEMRRVQVTTKTLKEKDVEARAAYEEALQWRTALVEQLQRKISGSIESLLCTPGTAAIAPPRIGLGAAMPASKLETLDETWDGGSEWDRGGPVSPTSPGGGPRSPEGLPKDKEAVGPPASTLLARRQARRDVFLKLQSQGKMSVRLPPAERSSLSPTQDEGAPASLEGKSPKRLTAIGTHKGLGAPHLQPGRRDFTQMVGPNDIFSVVKLPNDELPPHPADRYRADVARTPLGDRVGSACRAIGPRAYQVGMNRVGPTGARGRFVGNLQIAGPLESRLSIAWHVIT
jgi:hypothetical protein